MITKVRNKSQELNNKQITDDNIIEFLDDGLSDVLSIINVKDKNFLYKETEPLDIVTGQAQYDIPFNCAANRIKFIKAMDFPEWKRLREMSLNDEIPLINMDIDFPVFYIVKGDKLTLYPTPNLNVPGAKDSNGNPTSGLVMTYIERLPRLDASLGAIKNIVDGNKLYFDTLEIYDSNAQIKLYANDYISVTDGMKGNVTSYYRVLLIDLINNYIQIYTGTTGLAISAVNVTNRYFEFASASLTSIIPGDTLAVSGSTGNDGDYTIVGIDIPNYRVYVREVIPSIIADGTADAALPTTYREKTISSSAFDINYGDMATRFGYTTTIKLPDIIQDYVIGFAVKACFEKVQEPNQEAMVNLQRLSQAVESLPADRIETYKYQLRGTF